jgi:hypothetical protein
MKRYKLDYDDSKHRHALREYKAKNNEFLKLQNELKRFNLDCKDLQKLKENPLLVLEEIYLDKYKKENSLGLKFNKLAEILEHDFSNFFTAVERYEKIKRDISHEPQAEDFTRFTETEEQEKRYLEISKLLEAFKNIDVLNSDYMRMRLFANPPLNSIIEHREGEYKPRAYYVLNGK